MDLFSVIFLIPITSLWCMGLYIVTSDGKLLAFLRQPFSRLLNRKEEEYNMAVTKQKAEHKKSLALLELDNHSHKAERGKEMVERYNKRVEALRIAHQRFMFRLRLLNPFILCPACMSSVHSILIFSYTYWLGYHNLSVWSLPLIMLPVAFINDTIHDKLLEKGIR